MAENFPSTPFYLTLVGGILITIGGLGMAFLGAICGACFAGVGSIAGKGGTGLFGGSMIMLLMGLGFISGIIVLIGSFMIHKGDPGSVKKGSILTIIFSILGLARA